MRRYISQITIPCHFEHEFVRIRHGTHAHPELGLAQTRISALAVDKLAQLAHDMTTGVAITSAVGHAGAAHRSSIIGSQVDMNSLPIQKGRSTYRLRPTK